ncbi:MAG: methylated-DNA--[protein]-cysteine S-methyltransferase [Phenylobacterium sp.]
MTSRRPEPFRLDRIPTPVGEALVVTDADGALAALDFEDHEERMRRLMARYYGPATMESGRSPARDAVEAYFAGELRALEGLARRRPGTAFQQAAWDALCLIPLGAAWSYGQLAARIGAPRAVRAVGLANGANPIAVAVPCHRVIGRNGSLTGYGGGLARKAWLLEHEGARLVSQAA